jgi:hypothetical protein
MPTLTSSGGIGLFYHARLQTTGVTVTGSEEASGFIADEVLDWENPQDTWRTNNTTGNKTLVFDLGSALTTYGFYIEGVNVPAGSIQANATDSWGAPTINQSATFTLDSFALRRHGLFFFNADRSSIALRYLRLVLTGSQSPDGGVSYYQVGTCLPLVSPTELTNRRPLGLAGIEPVLENEWPGRYENAAIGVRQVQVDLPWEFFFNPIPHAADNEESKMLALATNPATPVVVCPDLNRPQQTYLCRRRGEIRWDIQQGIGASFPLAFSEVV